MGMVSGGEADASHINEAAAVIRHGSHILEQTERIHTVCGGNQCLQAIQAYATTIRGIAENVPVANKSSMSQQCRHSTCLPARHIANAAVDLLVQEGC